MDIYIGAYHSRTYNPEQKTFPMHIHNDTHEILYFVSGSVDYYVEGRRYPLKHGDLMLMRKGEAHYPLLNSNAVYERAVLNFDIPALGEMDPENRLTAPFFDRPLGKFNHYPAALFPDNHWLFYLEKMQECEMPTQRLCYLLPLLEEISRNFGILKNADTLAVEDRCSRIVKYINHHLLEDLSLSFLAEHFYLSKTHLNRVFRQSTGTTVWNYITVKRLFLARELINAGEPPTKVCLSCGFRDYNTFYRAYRQHFGVSPKQGAGHIDPHLESIYQEI